MKYQDCRNIAIKLSGNLFTEEQADELVSRVVQSVKRQSAEISAAEVQTRIANELAKDIDAIKLSALYQKRNAILNTVKKHNAVDRISSYENVDRGLKDFLSTIDNQRLGNQEYFMGKFLNAVNKEGLLPYFKGDGLGLDLARELFEATTPNGKIGITENTAAIKMAKLMTGINDELIKRQNAFGANIREKAGYIVRQTHCAERIKKAGFDEWYKDISQLLDEDLTFGALATAQERKDFLFEAYKKLSTGLFHVGEGAANSDFLTQFKGPGNLAKKLSQHRTLHFKDAESWYNYNQKYGDGRIEEIFMNTIMRGSKNIALLDNLGTNPDYMWGQIKVALQDRYRNDEASLKKIGTTFQNNMYKTLRGGLDVPENMTLYNWSNRILQLNAMSKLGGAVLSAMGDLPIAISELRYQGLHPMDALRNQIMSLFGKNRSDLSEGERHIYELMSSYNEGAMSDFMSRISPMDSDTKIQPGVMANMSRMFFKFSLLQPWTDASRTGMRYAMSNHLGYLSKNNDFNSLPDNIKTIFNKNGINDKDWEVLRKAAKEFDGKMHLFTDLINNVSDSDIKAIFPDMSNMTISQYKFELADKLQGLYVDRLSFGVITPGLEEKTITRAGTQRGTLWGEFLMHMMQFKSFPITIWNKIANPISGRDAFITDKGIDKKAFANYVGLMTQLTIAGYASTLLKDLANGKTPRDPKDPKTWTTAILAGGGFGLLGDFILGDYSKYGSSLSDSILGPTFGGTISDLTEIWSRAKSGEDPSAAVLYAVYSNIPGNNLFYTKWATNYLFLYNMQEAMSPGYLRRLEGRLQNNTGQKYFVPPSSVIMSGTSEKNIFGALGEMPERVFHTIGGQ